MNAVYLWSECAVSCQPSNIFQSYDISTLFVSKKALSQEGISTLCNLVDNVHIVFSTDEYLLRPREAAHAIASTIAKADDLFNCSCEGVHLDIEPWSLPAYSPRNAIDAYLHLLREITTVIPSRISLGASLRLIWCGKDSEILRQLDYVALMLYEYSPRRLEECLLNLDLSGDSVYAAIRACDANRFMDAHLDCQLAFHPYRDLSLFNRLEYG
jgi:hypothetical protein